MLIELRLKNFFAPGEGMNLVAPASDIARNSPSMIDTLVATIPANPIMSMANGEILQIIVFALFIGVAISGLGKKAEPVQKVIESGAEIMYQLTGVVMGFAPYGIFGLMAAVAGQNGLDVLLPLAKVIGSVYFGCAFLIMLSLVLSSVGLPMEGVALIAAIDRILDMARTWVNVQGDVMVSTIIAKSEGELDQAIFDDETAGEGEALNAQTAMA